MHLKCASFNAVLGFSRLQHVTPVARSVGCTWTCCRVYRILLITYTSSACSLYLIIVSVTVAAVLGLHFAELANAEVSGAAANALCQLCEECGAKLAPYLDTLMALYQRVTSSEQASTSGGGPPPAIAEDSIQQACPCRAPPTLSPQTTPHNSDDNHRWVCSCPAPWNAGVRGR